MAELAIEGFCLGIRTTREYDAETAERVREIEDKTDHLEDILGTYLARLCRNQISDEDSATASKLLKAIGDFERISDHAVNVVESVEELREKGIQLSDDARDELDVLCRAVLEILSLTKDAFISGDAVLAYDVEPLEQVIDGLRSSLRNSHIVRLKGGECTVEAGFIWADLLTDLERVSDHCSNVAVGIIDAAANTMNAHEILRNMRTDSAAYAERFRKYSEKYHIGA